MPEKNKLTVNCDTCDTRMIKEEDYSGYEQIIINADYVLVNERSKSVLNRLPIDLNYDDMIVLPDDVTPAFKQINGFYEITGASMPETYTILTVNGSLRIHPGTEEILNKYRKILVNGSVEYPKSLEGYLGQMCVNGNVASYPDDCILLSPRFVLDKYFPLRARENSSYYAKREIVIKDRDADVAKLIQKQVHFVTETLLVPECRAEEYAPLFDEQTDFVIVPDDRALVLGDAALNEDLIRRYGSRLFVYGNLSLDRESAELCGKVEALTVTGTVFLPSSALKAFHKIGAEYGRLETVRERTIQNMPRAAISQELLERSPDGIDIRNVLSVIFTEDASPELILERVSIVNCTEVICSETQESAVSAVGTNIVRIIRPTDLPDEGDDDGAAADPSANLPDARQRINADFYMM